MNEKIKLYLSRQLLAQRRENGSGETGLAFFREGPRQVRFWLLALAVGMAGGGAAVLFRFGIESLQAALYGTDDLAHLHSFAETLPWYWILAVPTIGGLVVGLVLNWFTNDGKVRSVADVIEASALHQGRVERRAGIGSALASFITLATGGSTGREGPVVHLASVISTQLSHWVGASGVSARELLGCAVAAAVSASFNAPIAGALFALEVVLRHFAIHAFAPIAIASVAGTVIGRLSYGNVSEFVLSDKVGHSFYVELPAFLVLGLVSGLVAVIFMRAIFWSDEMGGRAMEWLRLPGALRPALAGLALGVIANFYPHIIGVGYETTSAALTGSLVLGQAVIFAVVKTVAVSVTMAGRMGGGVFSPSLMMGALTGLAFGYIATSIFPTVSGSETLYALAGMGAVAAAVLGAPISTALIVFELTGDWQTGLAVLVAVSTSSLLASRLVERSFFLTLLEQRGVHIAAGPQAYLLSTLHVAEVMRGVHGEGAAPEEDCWALVEAGHQVDANATLDEVMGKFDAAGSEFLPVVKLGAEDEPLELIGAVFRADALEAFARHLSQITAEEHS